MNIEEIKKIVRQEMEDSSPSVKEVLKLNDSLKWWGNKCKEQEREIKRLNTIIRVAIEYIETVNTNENDTLHSMFLTENYISNYGALELLEILKGNENDNN